MRKVYVDIKNLEKIDSSVAGYDKLYAFNRFDRDFIWRDNETKEVFVFANYGLWGKEALEHPLMN